MYLNYYYLKIIFFAYFISRCKFKKYIVAEDGREQGWGGDALGISGSMPCRSRYFHEYGGIGHGLLTLGTTTIHAMDLKTFCRFGNIHEYESLNVVPYLLDQRKQTISSRCITAKKSRRASREKTFREDLPQVLFRARIFGIEERRISREKKKKKNDVDIFPPRNNLLENAVCEKGVAFKRSETTRRFFHG